MYYISLANGGQFSMDIKDSRSVVCGFVTEANEVDDEYKGKPQKKLYLQLGDSVKMMAFGVPASKFPMIGSFAAFEVTASSTGRTSIVRRWGWLDASKAGVCPDVLSVSWQFSVSQSVSNGVQSVGVSR